jgi:glutathione S-transferase
MLKLYTSQVCPFAHRCRLALAFKGLSHQRIEIDLAEMPPWYLDLSPNKKVPLLDDSGQKVWESAIINEYIEEAYPQQPLWPTEPLMRAKGRLAIDFAGNHIVPTFYHILRGQDADAPARMQAALDEMPRWMGDEGPFWLGSGPTLADAAIYPWFERWNVLEHYRQLQVTLPPRVQDWVDTLRAYPPVVGEVGDPDMYVQSYKRYTQPTPAAK